MNRSQLPFGGALALALVLASCAFISEDGATNDDASNASSSGVATSASSSLESASADDASTTAPPAEASTSSTTTSSTSTSSTTTANGSDNNDSDGWAGFRSPTGNIHCSVETARAWCSHQKRTPWHDGTGNPDWAAALNFGDETGCINSTFVGFEIADRGLPQALCGTAAYTAADNTLAYGERLERGDISCSSQRWGVTCLNGDGNGFLVATNEIAMIYNRPAGWTASQSSTKEAALPAAAIGAAQEIVGGKITTANGSATCYLSQFSTDGVESTWAECGTNGGGRDGAHWSPEGRSCGSADFSGYVMSDHPDRAATATFGCTTDLGPLQDPSTPTVVIDDGVGVRTGDVTCLNTGLGFACYNESGNGMLVSPNEISFFYNRDL